MPPILQRGSQNITTDLDALLHFGLGTIDIRGGQPVPKGMTHVRFDTSVVQIEFAYSLVVLLFA